MADVYDARFCAADLPGIMRNVLFASGCNVTLRALEVPEVTIPPRSIASADDLRLFEDCAAIQE